MRKLHFVRPDCRTLLTQLNWEWVSWTNEAVITKAESSRVRILSASCSAAPISAFFSKSNKTGLCAFTRKKIGCCVFRTIFQVSTCQLSRDSDFKPNCLKDLKISGQAGNIDYVFDLPTSTKWVQKCLESWWTSLEVGINKSWGLIRTRHRPKVMALFLSFNYSLRY